MASQIRLATAANTEPPLYYLLVERGYEIRIEHDFWVAEKETATFISESLAGVAGLVLLYETKGTNWGISDDLIEGFLNKFDWL